jgi:hypothetical protein
MALSWDALVIEAKAYPLESVYLEVSLELKACYAIDSPFSREPYVWVSVRLSRKVWLYIRHTHLSL